MFTTLLIFIALLVIFYNYVKYSHRYWERKGLKGPKTKFLVGNLFQSYLQKEAAVYEIDRIYRQYKDTQGIVGIYQFLRPHLMVIDTNICRDIFVKYFTNFQNNGFETTVNEKSDPLLAHNPFVLTGDAWKEKRYEIAPAFSSTRINVMYPLIEAVCKKMIQYLEKDLGELIDGRDLASRFTCDVVTKCGFGADAHAFDTQTPEIRRQMELILGTDISSLIKRKIMEICPSALRLLRIGFVPKDTEAFFRDLMRQAIDYRKNNDVNSQDYLDYLIKLKKKKGLTDVEVAANAITFLMDGLDTSAVAIAHVLFELANCEKAQEKLRTEINEAISKHGELSFDTLVHLPYLDQVFHETLRLHPPAGFTERECSESIDLDIGKDKKFFVEKGTKILIPIRSIHYDPNIYEEPEKFKPERFNDGAVKEYKDKSQFLTFGDGPRACLGQRFAKAQSKACIASIIRNFEITVNKKTITPLRVDPKEFIEMPLGGIWLNFKKI